MLTDAHEWAKSLGLHLSAWLPFAPPLPHVPAAHRCRPLLLASCPLAPPPCSAVQWTSCWQPTQTCAFRAWRPPPSAPPDPVPRACCMAPQMGAVGCRCALLLFLSAVLLPSLHSAIAYPVSVPPAFYVSPAVYCSHGTIMYCLVARREHSPADCRRRRCNCAAALACPSPVSSCILRPACAPWLQHNVLYTKPNLISQGCKLFTCEVASSLPSLQFSFPAVAASGLLPPSPSSASLLRVCNSGLCKSTVG